MDEQSGKPIDVSAPGNAPATKAICFARLIGPFTLVDANRNRVKFTANKERAIIAVLLMSENFERSRNWLASLLWSERGQSQASGSLRQALSRLRGALSERGLQEILIVDTLTVRIRRDLIEVDLFDHSDEARLSLAAGAQLLEGMDLRDPAFEDWLRETRQVISLGSNAWQQSDDEDQIRVTDDGRIFIDGKQASRAEISDVIAAMSEHADQAAASRVSSSLSPHQSAVEAISEQRKLIQMLVMHSQQTSKEIRFLRERLEEQEKKISFLEHLALRVQQPRFSHGPIKKS